MKTAGLVKLLFTGLNVILIFAMPWPKEPDELASSPTIPFLFLGAAIPCYYLVMWKGNKTQLRWPGWNTSPFHSMAQGPFGKFDFLGVLFAAMGVAMLISHQMNYHETSKVGQTSLSLGAGMLTGLLITVLVAKRQVTRGKQHIENNQPQK